MGYEQSIFSGTVGIIILVFVVVLVILWTLLPFAVFGIKGKLDQLIDSNREIRDQLARLNSGVSSLSEPATTPENSEEHLDFEVEPPAPREPPPAPGVRICPECEKRNSKANLVCAHCGAELARSPVEKALDESS
jgi:hypothetical protein